MRGPFTSSDSISRPEIAPPALPPALPPPPAVPPSGGLAAPFPPNGLEFSPGLAFLAPNGLAGAEGAAKAEDAAAGE